MPHTKARKSQSRPRLEPTLVAVLPGKAEALTATPRVPLGLLFYSIQFKQILIISREKFI